MKKLIIAFGLALLPALASAQRADFRIIPLPKTIQVDTAQTFALTEQMSIGYDSSNPEIGRIVSWLREYLDETAGVNLSLRPNDKKAAVQLRLATATKAKKGALPCRGSMN